MKTSKKHAATISFEKFNNTLNKKQMNVLFGGEAAGSANGAATANNGSNGGGSIVTPQGQF